MGERHLEATVGARAGLKFQRRATRPDVSPYDEMAWELRTAAITNEKGEVIFEQRNVEVPKDWSQTATNIVASKYFHGKRGAPERESSVRQLIGRVANTLTEWGERSGTFATPADRDTFRDELTHLLLHQKLAFNSPVWFNVGVQPHPQCSACFINSIDDSMDSIMNLAKTEGMLFKWGSGTGTNFSTLRGSMETLSGGGTASGPRSAIAASAASISRLSPARVSFGLASARASARSAASMHASRWANRTPSRYGHSVKKRFRSSSTTA